MTHKVQNGTVEVRSNFKGQPMFGIEKLPEGKLLLNEYTTDGIIKHEFDSHLAMELWVLKYRSLEFE